MTTCILIFTLRVSTLISAMNHERAILATTQCLCLAARRASRTITREFDQALRTHDLRATQFTLLAALQLKGPQSINALAGLLGAERTTVSRNLALVEKRALIRVHTDATDARSRIAAITEVGRESLHAAMPTWQQVQDKLTTTMGASAARGLRRVAGGPCTILDDMNQTSPTDEIAL